jgi:AhpD family alkylhydroperoxidase
MKYGSVAPEGIQRLRDLSSYIEASGLDPALVELVYFRVSQVNGCSYCVDLHWRNLRNLGADEQKLNGVVLWWEMPFFTDRERAALRWAEAVTRLADQRVPDEEYSAVKRHFGDKELVDLTLAISFMNALNRMGMAFHLTPRDPNRKPERDAGGLAAAL